jgi:hypothetical protein
MLLCCCAATVNAVCAQSPGSVNSKCQLTSLTEKLQKQGISGYAVTYVAPAQHVSIVANPVLAAPAQTPATSCADSLCDLLQEQCTAVTEQPQAADRMAGTSSSCFAAHQHKLSSCCLFTDLHNEASNSLHGAALMVQECTCWFVNASSLVL